MINVTQTFFPPINEYVKQINRIWNNKWLTNRGELTLELENKLKFFLELEEIILMNNGTVPIQIALKLLANNGEVITTPFSYVATSAAIIWENCKPVFVDIDPYYLTIDEKKIEAAITPRTTCILATHVFGNPCDVIKIDEIAKRHGLFVIYDAAHCFNVRYKSKSIFKYGDISTCSFHATKIFHTGEGGALICNNLNYLSKVYYSHNFGHDGPLSFHGLGINGKISELQSAMGLSVLPHVSEIFKSRKMIVEFYNQNLSFSNFRTFKLREETEWNYSYYPVIFETENLLLRVQEELNKNKVFPRRYFYPSINTISFIEGGKMEISEEISSKILCLPLSHQIEPSILNLICSIINKTTNIKN
jgi:dTDP-4-amino-4,6-dideoxygalactose transaminase